MSMNKVHIRYNKRLYHDDSHELLKAVAYGLLITIMLGLCVYYGLHEENVWLSKI